MVDNGQLLNVTLGKFFLSLSIFGQLVLILSAQIDT